MKDENTLRSFVLQVQEMRKAQKKYFSIFRKFSVKKEDKIIALDHVKKLEEKVDEEAYKILHGTTTQQSLF